MNPADELTSTNPATGEINWRGPIAGPHQVTDAVASARKAFESWSNLPLSGRIEFLTKLAEGYRASKETLAESICRETGKPKWEALTEVDAMIGKIPISIEAHADRCREKSRDLAGAVGTIRFRPHGVLAVLGPFNMPGHLPNGHIVPALLAGNTIVFKPSEQTPLIGERMMEIFRNCDFPAGVVNIVHGATATGAALAAHPGIDGLLFTGSTAGGLAIRKSLADQPGKILALEMGGNNPLIVHSVADLDAAALMTIQSAYITAGQRCSCARRLIVCPDPGDAFVKHLIQRINNIRIGFWTDRPEPFLGTVISKPAADKLLSAQSSLVSRGAIPLVEMKRDAGSPALLSPGLLDVTSVAVREDVEHFGPLLQLIRVKDFAAALREANQTRFGLSAGLISDQSKSFAGFERTARAGVIHINRPLTGASSQLPFGGLGQSGNHRPGGYLAADYASYAAALLQAPLAASPNPLPPGLAGGQADGR